VPVAAHEQQHGKLRAERGHAAFEDVATAFGDDPGQVVDETSAVITDGGNRDELLHGAFRRSV
jgi:hypothetical protein